MGQRGSVGRATRLGECKGVPGARGGGLRETLARRTDPLLNNITGESDVAQSASRMEGRSRSE